MRPHRGGGAAKWRRIAPDGNGWRRAPTPTNQKVRAIDARWARAGHCPCSVREEQPQTPTQSNRERTDHPPEILGSCRCVSVGVIVADWFEIRHAPPCIPASPGELGSQSEESRISLVTC